MNNFHTAYTFLAPHEYAPPPKDREEMYHGDTGTMWLSEWLLEIAKRNERERNEKI